MPNNSGSSSTLLTIGQNIVSAINSLKAALTPTSSGLSIGGTAGQIEYNNAGALGGFTASGDATINTATGAVTLASVITAAGPIGSSSVVPVITYDAKGRLTNVGMANIAGPTGTLVAVTVYSGSQTITAPAGATKAFIRMWGATGGSGGAGAFGGSGGSGAGGYLESYKTGFTGGTTTLTYTQAATGGAAGTSAPGAGGNAAAVTLTCASPSFTLTCNGSNGTAAGAAGSTGPSPSLGTAGATATGGDYNETGQAGSNGFVFVNATQTTAFPVGGAGGVNHSSIGAQGVAAAGSAIAGNAGTPGGLIIMWFS